MSFRLVPNSVTLDDLERRNSPNRSVISPNLVAFETDCVKLVEDIDEYCDYSRVALGESQTDHSRRGSIN